MQTGQTALHVGAACGKLEATKTLLSYSAAELSVRTNSVRQSAAGLPEMPNLEDSSPIIAPAVLRTAQSPVPRVRWCDSAWVVRGRLGDVRGCYSFFGRSARRMRLLNAGGVAPQGGESQTPLELARFKGHQALVELLESVGAS